MNNILSDKDCLTDALNAQKYATGHYNEFACEAATTEVRACVMSILNEEHKMQEELFDEMHSRGWYKTESAEQQKLDTTKNQFCSCQSSAGGCQCK